MERYTFEQAYREAEVKDGVREISYEQFFRLKDSYPVANVLSAESYDTGHIEGSLSFPVSTINKNAAHQTFGDNSKVIVYCGGFLCHASTNAARKLSKLGYEVLDYKGGLQEWQNKGHTLVIRQLVSGGEIK